jgi:formylglycine-generating enzyme required for sulfatase activity
VVKGILGRPMFDCSIAGETEHHEGGVRGAGNPTTCKTTDPYSVYDLVGNAAEWTDKCSGDTCAVRGGSFLDGSGALVCSSSSSKPKTKAASDIGFRCCKRE